MGKKLTITPFPDDGEDYRSNGIGGSPQGAKDINIRRNNQLGKLLYQYSLHPDLTGAAACVGAGISLASGYRMRISELKYHGFIEQLYDDEGKEMLRMAALGSPQMVCRITRLGRLKVQEMLYED